MTQTAYISLLANTKKLLLLASCDTTSGIVSVTGRTGWYDDNGRRIARREFSNSFVDL